MWHPNALLYGQSKYGEGKGEGEGEGVYIASHAHCIRIDISNVDSTLVVEINFIAVSVGLNSVSNVVNSKIFIRRIRRGRGKGGPRTKRNCVQVCAHS